MTNVPASLWDFFQAFENETLKRGYQVDLEAQGISAEIMEIIDDGVAGSCSYGSHQSGHIIIDETFRNQTNRNGHCSLHRGHREDANLDGTCKSIMRNGIEDCRDNYRLSTRDEYLDELFDLGN